jgi:hypothetical protein
VVASEHEQHHRPGRRHTAAAGERHEPEIGRQQQTRVDEEEIVRMAGFTEHRTEDGIAQRIPMMCRGQIPLGERARRLERLGLIGPPPPAQRIRTLIARQLRERQITARVQQRQHHRPGRHRVAAQRRPTARNSTRHLHLTVVTCRGQGVNLAWP